MKIEGLEDVNLEGNEVLEDALDFYTSQEEITEDVIASLAAAVTKRILDNGELLTFQAPTEEEMQEGAELEVQTLEMSADDEDIEGSWLPAFTSLKELDQSSFANEKVVGRSVGHMFALPLGLDIAGLVVNPGETAILVPSEVLEAVLDQVSEILSTADINLVLGDITEADSEAVVTSANNTLSGSEGGIDGAIHAAAGPELAEECRELRGCNNGEAKITNAYDLPARFVIHTVPPIYAEGDLTCDEILGDCYWNCLETARLHGVSSVAFPPIGTGTFGFPAREAAEIAADTVSEWMAETEEMDMEVTFVVDTQELFDIYTEVLDETLGTPTVE